MLPLLSFTCVQNVSAARCETSDIFDQGTCQNFTDNGTRPAGICTWEQENPVCQAAECGFYPVQSFCEAVAGCSWG